MMPTITEEIQLARLNRTVRERHLREMECGQWCDPDSTTVVEPDSCMVRYHREALATARMLVSVAFWSAAVALSGLIVLGICFAL